MRRVTLSDLEAFARVARARSFRAAAAAAGVSASSLSDAVRDLEARLGTRLLNRTTRSVAPTEAGARLLDRIGPAIAEIEAALDGVAEAERVLAGRLRINAPEPAIELALAPLVGPFLEAHPRIRLEIMSESALVDIVAEGFDAGVRWGESLAADMVAVPLGPLQRFVLVGAPGLVARTGAPQGPEDMLERPCIRQRFRSGVTPPWEFERDGRTLRLDPPARLVTSSIRLQHRAALEGLGYWLAFDGYVAEDVAAGRLVSLLEPWCPAFPGPFLYYPSRHAPPPLRAFVDFVRARRGEAAAPSLAP